MNKATQREREAALARVEKANNTELGRLARHTLGYDPFEVDRLVLPSVTRAKTLAIFKEKILSGKIKFEKE